MCRANKICKICGHKGMIHSSVQCWHEDCRNKTCGLSDCTEKEEGKENGK